MKICERSRIRGNYQNQTSANKGGGEGPNFGHFVITQ